MNKFAFLVAISFSISSANELKPINNSVKNLDLYRSVLTKEIPMSKDLGMITTWMDSFATGTSSLAQSKIALKKAYLKDIETDNSVVVGGGVTGYTDNDLIGSGNGTSTRLYGDIRWNLLKDGYFGKKLKEDVIKDEMDLLNFSSDFAVQSEKYLSRSIQTTAMFNQEKIDILRLKRTFLSDYLTLAKRLRFEYYFPEDEIIRIGKEISETEITLDYYDNYNRYASMNQHNITVDRLPIVELNISQIYSAMEANSAPLLNLKKRAVASKYDFRNEIDLNVFANYYTTSGNFLQTGDFMTGGVRVSIPLSFANESKEELKRVELNQLSDQVKFEQEQNRYEMLALYAEYKTKLNDYVSSYGQLLAMQSKLTVGLINYDENYEKTKVIDLIRNSLNIVDTRLELLEIKKQLFITLLKMSRYTKTDQLVSAMSIAEIHSDEWSSGMGERSLYIWSADFNRYDNEFLIHFLKNRHISTVIVSIGSKTDLKKLGIFCEKAHRDHLSVIGMISDNNLLFPDAQKKLEKRINHAKTLPLDGLHLDIEPHIFDDFKERKKEYYENYIAMVDIIKAIIGTSKLSLSVSIPVFYEENVVREIAQRSDKVYVMAYGIKNIEKLEQKIEEEFRASGEKMVIALRMKDFDSLYAAESFIEQLHDDNYRRFAFYDLKQMMELELKKVNNAITE